MKCQEILATNNAGRRHEACGREAKFPPESPVVCGYHKDRATYKDKVKELEARKAQEQEAQEEARKAQEVAGVQVAEQVVSPCRQTSEEQFVDWVASARSPLSPSDVPRCAFPVCAFAVCAFAVVLFVCLTVGRVLTVERATKRN